MGKIEMDLIFTTASIKRIFFALIISLFIFSAFNIYHQQSQSYWLVISGFLLAQLGMRTFTFKVRILHILVTGYAAAFTALIAGMLTIAWLQAIYLVLIIGVLMFVAQRKYFLPALIVAIFTVLGVMLKVSPTENYSRFIFIQGGMLICIIASLLYFLGYVQSEYKHALQQCVYYLRLLNRDVFACFINADYSTNLYLYEHRIHEQKRDFFTWFDRLRKLGAVKFTTAKNVEDLALINQFENLINITCDYAQLRTRVKDFATFELCHIEMRSLLVAIDNIYSSMFKKNNEFDLKSLNEKIAQLEDNYQHVLQVAARNPLDFIFFIQSLKTLQNILTHIIVNKK